MTRPDSRLCHYTIALYRTGSCTLHAASAVHHGLSGSTSVGSVCMADEGEYDVPRTINSSPHTPSHGIAGKTPCVHKSIASQALRAHLHLYTSLTHCVQGSARSSGSTSVGSVYGGRGGIRCASHYQFVSSYPITWHCGQEALPAQKHCEPSSACASSPVHFPERTAGKAPRAPNPSLSRSRQPREALRMQPQSTKLARAPRKALALRAKAGVRTSTVHKSPACA